MSRRREVVVYAHDAGGAAILAAFIRQKSATHRFRVFARGPAATLFRQQGIRLLNRTQNRERTMVAARRFLHDHPPAFFLCGTGSPMHAGLELIHACRKEGIRSVAFLDHWVNYRERFGYPSSHWKRQLPDEMWVGDREALRRARVLFPRHVSLRLVPNPYFADVRRTYRVHARKRPTGVLFVSEPMRGTATRAWISETQLATRLLAHFSRTWPMVPAIIRLHPSEPRDKYRALLQRFKKRPYRVSSRSTLLDDVASAFLVVGLESMALVIAGMCGKTVLRFPARKGSREALPIPGTVVTSDAAFRKQIDRYVEQHLRGSKTVGTRTSRHPRR